MDQWHVVSEGRWDGVLVLTVRKGRAHAYRTVPYYDEFTEQSVFKAVQRGNTDPRAYCMGCGVDEGELHEHWCHAVKEANRKKAAHRHSAMAHNHSEWAFQSCKTGNWHRARFKHGEFALCPGCKMHVKEPERPPASPSVGEQIRQALAPFSDEAVMRRASNHRAFADTHHWAWITCVSGQWRDAEYGFKNATCPECKGAVEAPKRHRPAHAPYRNEDTPGLWRFYTCKGRDQFCGISHASMKCADCGLLVHQNTGNSYNLSGGQPEDRYLPGRTPPGPSPSEGQRRELKQPSAVAQAKAFHLRPPRREIVVLVDDQSEPP